MIIRNKRTGQTMEVADNELSKYGITPPQPQVAQPKTGGISEFAPVIGQILGGIGGGLVGNIPGAVAGAAAGGGLGEAYRQKTQNIPTDIGKIGKEAAWGAGSELMGIGIAKGAGKLLSKVAPKLAGKAVGASASQIDKFATKTGGENLVEFATKRGLLTRNLDDVNKAISPVQEAFDSIAKSSGKKIPVSNVIKNMLDEATVISQKAGTAYKAQANKLLREAIDLENKFGAGMIDVGDLTKARIGYDKLVTQFAANPAKKSVYQLARDIVQKTIQDETGDVVVKGQNLKQLGSELNKLYAFKDVVKKTSGKGIGSELMGLGALGRGGVGAGGAVAVSALAGERDPADLARNALIGAGLSSLLNNPKVIGKLVAGIGAGGESLKAAASQVGGNKASQLLTLLSQGTGATVKGLLEPSSQNIPSQTTYTENKPVVGIHTPNIPQGITSEQIRQAKVIDILQNNGRNFSKLDQLEKIISPAQTKVTEAESAKQNVIKLAQSALQDLQTKQIKTGLIAGPLEQKKAIFGKGDEPTLAFQNKIAQMKAAIAKARAGTSFTPNEEKLLNKYAPTDSDSLQQLNVKLNGLMEFFGSMSTPTTSTDILQNLQGLQ